MSSSPNILVVDDDDGLREMLELLLGTKGYKVRPADGVPAALELLHQHDFDLILSDVRMPGGGGKALLEKLRAEGDLTPFILLTAYGTIDDAVAALKLGANDYLQKPFDKDDLLLRIERGLANARVTADADYLRTERDQDWRFGSLIGVSPTMKKVASLIKRVAQSDASVLLTGETGTGKELAAREIHDRSARSDRLLVPVNVAALPRELIETELFGHERGAFTGATDRRLGRFEVADGGTLFLDEIGEAPIELQAKLLRVIQDGMIQRVGATKERSVDVRLITATNRDLNAMVDQHLFRSDLLYRIRVIEIRLPPLRERREDIRYLIADFLQRMREGRTQTRITERALALLQRYDWPGNVRELRNVVERADILSDGDVIDVEHLEFSIDQPSAGGGPVLPTASAAGGLSDALDSCERDIIEQALLECDGVKARAARLLHVSERTLWYKLRKHGLT
ncbi:MAG: two-component system response regulator AtoC [Hyphomicrobiaceae bacterium]|jgi:two-component system response regulator AtoC